MCKTASMTESLSWPPVPGLVFELIEHGLQTKGKPNCQYRESMPAAEIWILDSLLETCQIYFEKRKQNAVALSLLVNQCLHELQTKTIHAFWTCLLESVKPRSCWTVVSEPDCVQCEAVPVPPARIFSTLSKALQDHMHNSTCKTVGLLLLLIIISIAIYCYFYYILLTIAC